jgi:hypothetical protein
MYYIEIYYKIKKKNYYSDYKKKINIDRISQKEFY